MFPGMETAEAWLGSSEEVGGGASLLYFLRGGCVLRKMPPKECAGMISSPRDSLPGCIVPVLFWPTGSKCHGILNYVGQGGWLLPSPQLYPPHRYLLRRKGSERQGAEIKGPQQGAHHPPKTLLDDARSEIEREQEVGQVTHFG